MWPFRYQTSTAHNNMQKDQMQKDQMQKDQIRQQHSTAQIQMQKDRMHKDQTQHAAALMIQRDWHCSLCARSNLIIRTEQNLALQNLAMPGIAGLGIVRMLVMVGCQRC